MFSGFLTNWIREMETRDVPAVGSSFWEMHELFAIKEPSDPDSNVHVEQPADETDTS